MSQTKYVSVFVFKCVFKRNFFKNCVKIIERERVNVKIVMIIVRVFLVKNENKHNQTVSLGDKEKLAGEEQDCSKAKGHPHYGIHKSGFNVLDKSQSDSP